MNRLSPRSIKNAYRRDRITGSLILAAIVNIFIGGFGDRATLVALGLLIVLGSVAWRWLQVQSIQSTTAINNQRLEPKRYLSAASGNNTPLPLLTQKKSSRR